MVCRPVFILNTDRGLQSDRWYAKRADDQQISAYNGATRLPSRWFSRYSVRAYSVHSIRRRADVAGAGGGKIATVLKEIAWRKHVKNDSGERERVDYAETAGAYGWTSMPLFTIVALRTVSHLKSTQFFEDSLTRNLRSGPCASLPSAHGASSWIRGCLRVLRSASKLCYFW